MRSRVIISNVKPSTCGEDFYFKRTPGEQVQVSADIFADGEETIQASLLFKHQSEKKWQEAPMQQLGDDAWTGSFTVEKKGFYQYRIEGWVEGQKQFAAISKETWQVRVGRKQEIFSTWYEMFPRSASPVPGRHGTLQDVENLLPRLAEMGFDVLLFPPIFPVGKTGRKGKDNSSTTLPDDVGAPWAVGSEEGGHTTIHASLGTMADFERLMKTASVKGIEIALDLALRCSPDHPYVKEHPEWFHRSPDGKVIIEEQPPISYGDSVNFDICCDDWENLWQELKNNLLFWAEKGVRIFYGSAPHYKPFSFLKWLISEVQKEYPDVIFVSGAITRTKVAEELAKCGFAQSFTHFMWKNTADELRQHLLDLSTGISREILRPNFFTNT
ncbi:MAG: maltotransferase domain-containing protein, partial [Bacteroidota bacterium]